MYLSSSKQQRHTRIHDSCMIIIIMMVIHACMSKWNESTQPKHYSHENSFNQNTRELLLKLPLKLKMKWILKLTWIHSNISVNFDLMISHALCRAIMIIVSEKLSKYICVACCTRFHVKESELTWVRTEDTIICLGLLP